MSGPFGSSQWMYSSGGFYPQEIEQSLRFNDGDSAYLNRSFSAGDSRTTWTLSLWLKLGDLTSREDLFSTALLGYNEAFLAVEPNARLRFYDYDNSIGAYRARLEPAGRLRDPSAWYHIVITFDTTNATSSERCRMYINGVRQTEFDFETYPSQNYQGFVNAASTYYIGRTNYNNYLDGYLAEVNFIDGQALDQTSFGEFKSGVWVAKSYAGSYGTNGFYLNFSDSANIGDDLSGNANDWTANNLVATDVLSDSPTNNFCTFNPLDKASSFTLSDGNLYNTNGTAAWNSSRATMGVSSGKYYWEITPKTALSSNPQALLGIGNSAMAITGNVSATSNVVLYDSYSGKVFPANTAYGASYTNNDVIGMALDLDAGTITFYKNGVSQGVAATGLTGTWFPTIMVYGNASFEADFGQSGYAQTPPANHLALSTANLPTPAIDPAKDDVPADYFNTVLYTGDGTDSNSITGLGFEPSLSWFKRRDASGYYHELHDQIRGADKALFSNATDVESTRDSMISFDADGFTVGTQGGVHGGTNLSGGSYVAWNWKASGAGASNTDGSITSTVSVNQKAGFSIVSYTGNGTSGATVGHGLGAAPKMIFVKGRQETFDWKIYHANLTSGNTLRFTTGAQYVDANYVGSPSSSVFTCFGTDSVNASTKTYIAYCFAEVEGYSKFGSYTGNGSTDGPFIFTGHRPAWIMVKRTDSTGDWTLLDAERSPDNDVDDFLWANLSNAELANTTADVDFLSNGFKIRNTTTNQNTSGGTYIYMAFAENPFKYANAR